MYPTNRRQTQTTASQHQRFSWQPPVESLHERQPQAYNQPQQYAQQQQQPARIDTTVDLPHSRTFSYAQTPAEHIAFQYIPSPSDIPPVPRIPTPIDERPQSIFAPQLNPSTQPQPGSIYPSPAPEYQENLPVSPLSPRDHTTAPFASPVSPVPEPQPVYTQQTAVQQNQHTKQMSNLSRINTKVGLYNMPPVPATLHVAGADLPHKIPVTPITPSSIKKDPIPYVHPTSPASQVSYAHQPYSPHGLGASTTKSQHAVFSPDSAHGPNGLDFALHQPGQIAHPNMDLSASGTAHEWKTSFCSCSDISTCLTGLACPCILYGKTAYRLNQKSNKADPTDLLSYKAVNGHCMMMTLSCGLWWLFPMVQRTRLRHMYKLEGSLGGDCVRGACCCCCTAIQNEKEIRTREDAKRQWAGPASADVYKKTPQMQYTPQH